MKINFKQTAKIIIPLLINCLAKVVDRRTTKKIIAAKGVLTDDQRTLLDMIARFARVSPILSAGGVVVETLKSLDQQTFGAVQATRIAAMKGGDIVASWRGEEIGNNLHQLQAEKYITAMLVAANAHELSVFGAVAESGGPVSVGDMLANHRSALKAVGDWSGEKLKDVEFLPYGEVIALLGDIQKSGVKA